MLAAVATLALLVGSCSAFAPPASASSAATRGPAAQSRAAVQLFANAVAEESQAVTAAAERAVLSARAPAPFAVVREEFAAEVSEMELAEQEGKLTALSKKWEKREAQQDFEDSMRSGWGPSPERINGRTAMFFIIVGLVTEYYTGQSLPQQVYTMLQTLSIVE